LKEIFEERDRKIREETRIEMIKEFNEILDKKLSEKG